jgi:hypothetical protein
MQIDSCEFYGWEGGAILFNLLPGRGMHWNYITDTWFVSTSTTPSIKIESDDGTGEMRDLLLNNCFFLLHGGPALEVTNTLATGIMINDNRIKHWPGVLRGTALKLDAGYGYSIQDNVWLDFVTSTAPISFGDRTVETDLQSIVSGNVVGEDNDMTNFVAIGSNVIGVTVVNNVGAGVTGDWADGATADIDLGNAGLVTSGAIEGGTVATDAGADLDTVAGVADRASAETVYDNTVAAGAVTITAGNGEYQSVDITAATTFSWTGTGLWNVVLTVENGDAYAQTWNIGNWSHSDGVIEGALEQIIVHGSNTVALVGAELDGDY